MTAADGVSFEVATGVLCLDFIYTGGEAERARWESLHEPADLEQWLRTSRLADIAPVPATVRVTAADLAQARELREVVWRSANALVDENRLRPDDGHALNRWARKPDMAPAMVDGRLCWQEPVTGPQLLSTLARDAISLAAGPLAHRVRRCAADDCALLFVDNSRPGKRRWCAMSRCGNRNKARKRRRRDTDQHDKGEERNDH